MSTISAPAQLLRQLPASVRSTIYTVVVIAGAFLGICQALGIDSLGSVSIDQALQVYAYAAPLTGVVAVANVARPDAGVDYAGLEEPSDLSLFEPVGDPDDVYAV
jgi:hypothetical protein